MGTQEEEEEERGREKSRNRADLSHLGNLEFEVVMGLQRRCSADPWPCG